MDDILYRYNWEDGTWAKIESLGPVKSLTVFDKDRVIALSTNGTLISNLYVEDIPKKFRDSMIEFGYISQV